METNQKTELQIIEILYRSLFLTQLKQNFTQRITKKQVQELKSHFKEAMRKAKNIGELEEIYFKRITKSKIIGRLDAGMSNFIYISFAAMKAKSIAMAETAKETVTVIAQESYSEANQKQEPQGSGAGSAQEPV